MRVLHAAAEVAPLVRVGGLAEAVAGMTGALRRAGVDVDVVVPGYRPWELDGERILPLAVPAWAGPAVARSGTHDGGDAVTVIDLPGLARAHPYVDEHGTGFPDNDRRFFAFSAAVAAYAARTGPDLVHLHDWHTALAPALAESLPPTLLTVHTIGYQGQAHAGWLDVLVRHHEEYLQVDHLNPLAGAIAVADRVVTVSPHFAAEIVRPGGGFGLHDVLAGRGDDLSGILNGIDVGEWDPRQDPHLVMRPGDGVPFAAAKAANRLALLEGCGWPGDTRDMVVGMVTRLVEQKGVDLALAAAPFLAALPARLVVLGSGERRYVDWCRQLAMARPDHVAFTEGYDVSLSHRIFAGSDVFLMPSRFEPCGLAQMQAMVHGTVPVVTAVGGLVDTVVDDDGARASGRRGTGFVAEEVSTAGVVAGLHRAARSFRNRRRFAGIAARGQAQDWSWERPARRYLDLYEELLA